MANLVALAEAFGQQVTTPQLKIYAQELEDIEPTTLAVAFHRACRELKYFPKIAELRSLAGDGAEGIDEEIDAAWLWITRHVARHGVRQQAIYRFGDPEMTVLGKPSCRQEIERRGIAFKTAEYRKAEAHLLRRPDSSMCGADVPTQFMFTAIPPPPIPPTIEYALLQLAFNLHDALERIKDADSFTRKEFAEAFTRGRAIERRETMALKLAARPALGDGGEA